jgi:uncharacterized protein (DUF2147 family)
MKKRVAPYLRRAADVAPLRVKSMQKFRRIAAGLAGAGLLVAMASSVQAAPPVGLGLTAQSLESTEWRNPKNSVHIRAEACGDNLCGTINWASDKAIADARRGGNANLVGTRIFREFQRGANGTWRGKLYVPDMQKTFSGTIQFPDSNTMVGTGCVMLGLICKSQTWTRVR